MAVRGEKRVQKGDPVVTLVLGMEGGKVVTTVASDAQNLLGPAMTREQVLASPLCPLIFQLADFIVAHDPHLRPFLEDGVLPLAEADE